MSMATVVRALTRLAGWVPADEAHECMYGKTATASSNCTRWVPAHEGWRRNGMVFCSSEHAAADQEDALI
ncbi:hypothetical protein [Modestobacter sp. SSW1-42]|uniref:hypothetical protein n=1 Tax=Modestobacter sp. SSW1-42 TaxID=596372 RepID=UPI00398817D5